MKPTHATKADIVDLMDLLNSIRPIPALGVLNCLLLVSSVFVAGYGAIRMVMEPADYIYWICMMITPIVVANILSETMSLLAYCRVSRALKAKQPSLEATRAVLDAGDLAGAGWGARKALSDYAYSEENQ